MLAINQQIQGIQNTAVVGRGSCFVLPSYTSTLSSALVTVMEIIDGQRGDEALQYTSAGKKQRILYFWQTAIQSVKTADIALERR